MEFKSLNGKNLILAKMGGVFNSLFSKKQPVRKNLSGFIFLKDLTSLYSREKLRVGIYRSIKYGKVVLKRHKFTFLDMDFLYINNEGCVLRILNSLKGVKRIFPQIIETNHKNNEIILATSLEEGIQLDKVSRRVRLEVVKRMISDMVRISEKLSESGLLFRMPRRRSLGYILSFFTNLVRLIIKDLENAGRYLNLGAVFYFNYFTSFPKENASFSHRDLYPDNIVFSKKNNSYKILDWESAVYTDRFYDLSQIAMIYTKDFGTKDMIKILTDNLNNNKERSRFYALAIFNSIQILSINKPSEKVFEETDKFLDSLKGEIMPVIFYKKSPFELIYEITLDLISLFYKLTGFNKYSTNKKIVLCYHSVANTNWRFSSRVKDFSDHLQFLLKHYKLVSLSKLLNSNSSGVNISFDDGYEDVLKNAFFEIKKVGASATMFALGDYKNPNRMELDNNLKILNIAQLKFLQKNDWEIGYHSKTHASLDAISDDELYREVVLGKAELEKNLGFNINYFAYPKGKYSKKVVGSVKKAGFKAAFTVDGSDMKLKDKYLLDRVPMEGELSIAQLEALLSPIGLVVAKFYMKVLQVKEKISVSAQESLKAIFNPKIEFSVERHKL